MSAAEYNENKLPDEPASPGQGRKQNRNVLNLRPGRDSAQLVPDICAGTVSPIAPAKPEGPISSVFSDTEGRPFVATQPRPAEKPITQEDREKEQQRRLAVLLDGSVQFPDSSSVLVRVTTREDADAVLGQLPPVARRGFVREIPGHTAESQHYTIGIFSIDPTERDIWQTQPEITQQDESALFTHDSGLLGREELAFAQRFVEQESEKQIAFIKGGTRFGRLDSRTLDQIETERHRSRMEVKLLMDAAYAIAPESPGIHDYQIRDGESTDAAFDMSQVKIIVETPEDTYGHAREQLSKQLATADSKTFDAIREWTQHKEDALRVEAALRHQEGTGTPLTEAQVRDARAFRDTDNDMQDKCNGPDGARYRRAQKLFQQALFVYEQATPHPSSTAENSIDLSTERQKKAFAAFLEDFDQLDRARLVDVYHDARVELLKDLGNNTHGTPLFEAVMTRLEHRKAKKEIEFFELKKGKGNDAFIDDQIHLRRRKSDDAIASLLEITIDNARLGLDTAVNAFRNYMRLSSADIRIPARDRTSLTRLQREIMVMEKIIADMKAVPASEAENGTEASKGVTIYKESTQKAATDTATEHKKPEKEFGKNKKEDFRMICQLAEAYVRDNPGLVHNSFTLFQTSVPGLFDHRESMRIRDVLALNLGVVTVVHDGHNTRKYKVTMQLTSVYDGWKEQSSGTISWFQGGKKVELPSYISYPRNPLVSVPHYYDDSEITRLDALPENFNLSSITLEPIDPPPGAPDEKERYSVSVTQNGDRTRYRIYGIRGEDRQAHALPMYQKEYRRKLKEILEQLPGVSQ